MPKKQQGYDSDKQSEKSNESDTNNTALNSRFFSVSSISF